LHAAPARAAHSPSAIQNCTSDAGTEPRHWENSGGNRAVTNRSWYRPVEGCEITPVSTAIWVKTGGSHVYRRKLDGDALLLAFPAARRRIDHHQSATRMITSGEK